MTALMYACSNGHESVVSVLFNTPNIDVNQIEVRHQAFNRVNSEEEGYNALMFACSKGYGEIVSQLLRLDAIKDTVNETGWDGCTALVLSVFHREKKIVFKLLDVNGIDVNVGMEGDDVLATMTDNTEGQEKQVVTEGWTALTLAVYMKQNEIVDRLLDPKFKAKIDGALRIACQNTKDETVRQADVALRIACQNTKDEIVRVLYGAIYDQYRV